jgi:hypothetical protein
MCNSPGFQCSDDALKSRKRIENKQTNVIPGIECSVTVGGIESLGGQRLCVYSIRLFALDAEGVMMCKLEGRERDRYAAGRPLQIPGMRLTVPGELFSYFIAVIGHPLKYQSFEQLFVEEVGEAP